MDTEELQVEVLSEEEKRELRRKRRKRNQLIARISLVLFAVLFAVLIAIGISMIKKRKSQAEKEMESNELVLEDEQTEENVIAENTEEETLGTPEIQEFDPEQILDEVVESVISEMTIEEKVAGLFIVTPESITGVDTAVQAGEGTKEALTQYPVGGLIYSKKNMKSEEQLKEMIANSVSYNKYPLFIAVEEEGGDVSPLANALSLDKTVGSNEIGSSMDNSKAGESMKKIEEYLLSYGFNLNFGLVADVAEEGSFLNKRSFGQEVSAVSEMVAAALEGTKESEVTTALKYFPGMGSAKEDTSQKVVVIDKSKEDLMQKELIPFITAIQSGAEMIMVGHGSYPQLSGDNTPASMSREVVSDLLRTELEFNGIVITDALNKAAVTEYYGADEAAVKALKAGADMLLMPEDFKLAYEGILNAVKEETISEERIDHCLKRIYRIKYWDSVGE